MGIVVILANQNLILFATFNSYSFGSPRSNTAFSSACFTLFAVLGFFAMLLFQFKKEVTVAAPTESKRPSREAAHGDYIQDQA